MEVIKEREKIKKEQIISAKEQKNYYLCNKTTSIGVNRAVEFKCIFFVIYTTSSDYQEHLVDSSYQVSIPHFILKELTVFFSLGHIFPPRGEKASMEMQVEAKHKKKTENHESNGNGSLFGKKFTLLYRP